MEEENDEPVHTERYSLMEDEDWRTRGGNIWSQTQEKTGTRVKCRATTCQLVQVVKFMEEHPQLAVSHAKPFPGSDRLWMKLADHINQFGPPKNYKQCKTTWRDLRKRAFAMHRSRNKKGTGRNLYGMAPKIVSLITQAGGTVPQYKEEDEGSASSSRPDTPPAPREPLPAPTPVVDEPNVKTEKTKGEQLVIRVTDNLGSNRNVFNRFTINDGHFENVIVKEEMFEGLHQEEDEMDPTETEAEGEPSGEEMFLQPEAILGNADDVMEEKNSVIRDLNDTLKKFLTEYKTRNALMRERIDLERARLQFDMEVYRSRQMEKRVIAVNAANNAMNAKTVGNASNVITVNASNAMHVGNANNTITVGSANVGKANVITVNATAANATTKANPVITLNPLNVGNAGTSGISVKVENTGVSDANVANAAKTTSVANVKNVVNVPKTENAKAPNEGETAKAEDAMDDT